MHKRPELNAAGPNEWSEAKPCKFHASLRDVGRDRLRTLTSGLLRCPAILGHFLRPQPECTSLTS